MNIVSPKATSVIFYCGRTHKREYPLNPCNSVKGKTATLGADITSKGRYSPVASGKEGLPFRTGLRPLYRKRKQQSPLASPT